MVDPEDRAENKIAKVSVLVGLKAVGRGLCFSIWFAVTNLLLRVDALGFQEAMSS